MTTTAIGASRAASERRSGSEFVQSNECEGARRADAILMKSEPLTEEEGEALLGKN
jgi:hypothetical protein